MYRQSEGYRTWKINGICKTKNKPPSEIWLDSFVSGHPSSVRIMLSLPPDRVRNANICPSRRIRRVHVCVCYRFHVTATAVRRYLNFKAVCSAFLVILTSRSPNNSGRGELAGTRADVADSILYIVRTRVWCCPTAKIVFSLSHFAQGRAQIWF